ncbi:hypothetical protein [Chitinophaga nivalis]|uniref:Uncharacterized protein n=1 Tax=Chitinophaga nivalis TaxID=2991709 RepID=A0ABT3IHD4_9BACT|nr:hypothetical protein [Chitinophaga nivalis]MCW3466929.1 hypothetical protein [Chitinophaga nivalis]MCW3483380.1 hypothetical protein [Chitinophaga nivalis]
MNSWHIIIIVTGMILSGILLWLEYHRANRRRRIARLIATIIAVATVCLLAIPFQRTIRQPAPEKIPAVVWPSPSGIVSCNWPLQRHKGQLWQVQGRYENTAKKEVWLRLSGFDTALDSLLIPAGATTVFNLKTIPLHLGPAVYRITALAGKDTLEQQPLPVEVKDITPMAILILAAAPDFENRFLADWLTQQGYTVAMRTLVSKNKYAVRFSNTPPLSLEQLSPAVLDKFDVVITDPASLTKTIQSQLEQAGIGLIRKADSTGTHPQPLALQLQQTILPPLQTDPVAAVHNSGEGLPLVTDSVGRVYVSVAVAGQSRRIQTGLLNTSNWLLEGKESVYQQYWAVLLEAAARRKHREEIVRLEPAVPRVNEPVTITLDTKGDGVVYAGKAVIAMAQDPWLPSLQTGTWWPLQAGWQLLATPQGTHRVYIYRPGEWQQLSVAAPRHEKITTPAREITTTVRLSPWWLIIPLLGALGFLWLEKKM